MKHYHSTKNNSRSYYKNSADDKKKNYSARDKTSKRKKRDQIEWMMNRDYKFEHFSDYWFLRFDNYGEIYKYKQINISHFTRNFDEFNSFQNDLSWEGIS